jgi:hypothetical protein
MDGHGELEKVINDMLHDLEQGATVVMEEGVRYNAQCDGKNHYLYRIDTSAVNPKTGHGYSKGRIYEGTFEQNKSKCPAYADYWQGRHKHGTG